ncbi:Aspartic peptidase domain [Cinara cedri]|uniref:Aspartic peptidase domain n=1 Tax=Cinara cedri TaxID=506608 RepID=A0A5E4NGM3_9HEMI|nr:Aspartic peptidase domain [Cinara cedri]
MFNVGNWNSVDPIILHAEVNKISVDFELDSGAGISLLPDRVYKSNNFMCNIFPSKNKLKMHNGVVIEPFVKTDSSSWGSPLVPVVLKLLFGTKPSRNIFKRIVEKILQGLKGVINFQDDVITGKSDIKHLNKIEKSEIHYLRHIVSAEGVKKNTDAVKAISEMSRPKNANEIRT